MGLFGFCTKKKEENIVKTCVWQASNFVNKLKANNANDFVFECRLCSLSPIRDGSIHGTCSNKQ